MMWRPDFKRDVCERLRRAAGYIRTNRHRHSLAQAALTICVLKEDEFPADFRTQFREVIAVATADHTRSIDEGVGALTDDEVRELCEKIMELYEDTCEGQTRLRQGER
jgi:hypothetical protein